MGGTATADMTKLDDQLKELGDALAAAVDGISNSGDEGKAAMDALKESFSFVESEEFGEKIGEQFTEAGGGEALNFEQFYPLIVEASSEFGEKISEDDAKEAFSDIDEDGSGKIELESLQSLLTWLSWQQP